MIKSLGHAWTKAAAGQREIEVRWLYSISHPCIFQPKGKRQQSNPGAGL
jgi:hypothetical protein